MAEPKALVDGGEEKTKHSMYKEFGQSESRLTDQSAKAALGYSFVEFRGGEDLLGQPWAYRAALAQG
jgi:hypothetical protein